MPLTSYVKIVTRRKSQNWPSAAFVIRNKQPYRLFSQIGGLSWVYNPPNLFRPASTYWYSTFYLQEPVGLWAGRTHRGWKWHTEKVACLVCHYCGNELSVFLPLKGGIKHRLPTSGRDQELVTIPLKNENTLQIERIAAWRGFLSSFYWYSYSYALGTGTRLIQMKN